MKTAGDFFVAGRRLGPGLMFATHGRRQYRRRLDARCGRRGLPARHRRLVVGRLGRARFASCSRSWSVRGCAASRRSAAPHRGRFPRASIQRRGPHGRHRAAVGRHARGARQPADSRPASSSTASRASRSPPASCSAGSGYRVLRRRRPDDGGLDQPAADRFRGRHDVRARAAVHRARRRLGRARGGAGAGRLLELVGRVAVPGHARPRRSSSHRA